MGYSIEDCTDDPTQLEEAAEFLAAYTADGEGPSQMPEDQLASHWRKRFRWWWDDNPYCHEDSPRGLLLRDEEGVIVGFFGFIPHDYICDGKRVPSLIFAATYVRLAARDAAFGLWMRAQRLRERFHLVDGGPSLEVQELLSKAGYHHAEPARLHFIPVRKRLTGLRPLALRVFRAVAPHREALGKAGRIVGSLDEVKSVPVQSDSRVRKHIDLESIRWYLESGSTPRYFIGRVDPSGTLLAYVIAEVRRKKKLNVQLFSPVDAHSFNSSDDSLLCSLLSHAARSPEDFGVPEAAEFLVLPLSPNSPEANRRGTVEARHRVYYRLPREFEGQPRQCCPWEGDIFSY